jgi:[ribosomal protein S5]-alanine N-acetyltransferase
MAIRMHATHPSNGCPTSENTAGRSLQPVVASNWHEQLPVLASAGVVLRQLKQSDAAALFMLLTTEEVARFITPPPTTLAGFEQFISWALDRQRQGKVAFFAITLRGSDAAVGLFQLRGLDTTFTTAEWGFALGSPYWGTGLFPQGAALTLEFAFETVGVERLEARSMVANARGNAALRKAGATPEGLLRQSFEKNGRRHDQYLWSILAQEWRESRGVLVPDRATDSVSELATDARTDAPGAALWADARTTILVRVH